MTCDVLPISSSLSIVTRNQTTEKDIQKANKDLHRFSKTLYNSLKLVYNYEISAYGNKNTYEIYQYKKLRIIRIVHDGYEKWWTQNDFTFFYPYDSLLKIYTNYHNSKVYKPFNYNIFLRDVFEYLQYHKIPQHIIKSQHRHISRPTIHITKSQLIRHRHIRKPTIQIHTTSDLERKAIASRYGKDVVFNDDIATVSINATERSRKNGTKGTYKTTYRELCNGIVMLEMIIRPTSATGIKMYTIAETTYGYKVAKLPYGESAIVKLEILGDVAKSAGDDKIRAKKVKVIDIAKCIYDDNNMLIDLEFNQPMAISCVHCKDFQYVKDSIIEIDDFDGDLNRVCVPGIHFYYRIERIFQYLPNNVLNGCFFKMLEFEAKDTKLELLEG